MKVKLLIATEDCEYAKLLSDSISEHHENTIDVSVCNDIKRINEEESNKKYNVALVDTAFIEHINAGQIHLLILLCSKDEAISDSSIQYVKINKYQRISSIVAKILESYAKVAESKSGIDSKHANITAVWSPAGGVGKTCVALAYALSHVSGDSISEAKKVFYLNLEDFSSIPSIFNEKGKSISSVFEMLESNEGNTEMLIQAISCCEKNITFLSSPDNYDDLCILSGDNVNDLILSCAKLTDELVIDLSCACNQRVRKVFELANRVLLVTDGTDISEAKINQFVLQNGVYESIKEKVTIIANKDSVFSGTKSESVASIPFVQSSNTITLCTELSKYIYKMCGNDYDGTI